jgi:SAM-dependent methyltransferase
MNFELLAEVVSRSVRERGAFHTVRKVIQYLLNTEPIDDFDVKNGTDTSGIEPLWQFSISSPNARFGGRYHAIEEWELAGALKVLHEDIGSSTFVDLGCGKGRALLIAARLGFKRMIGVEFAAELAAIARRNIQIAALANASVVDGDAAEFSFPDGDLVVFLFNPFKEDVMREVVSHLEQSRPGKRYVIYANPICAEIFDASRAFTRVGSSPARWLPTIVWKLAQDLCGTTGSRVPAQVSLVLRRSAESGEVFRKSQKDHPPDDLASAGIDFRKSR